MSANYKPGGPVTLNEDQILVLHQKLRNMRHDVNGRLANIVAAAESIAEFSREFEDLLGLERE